MSTRVCSNCKKESALFSGTTLCEPCNAQLILENNEIEERTRLSAKPRRKFLVRDAIGLALLVVFIVATIIFALGAMNETLADQAAFAIQDSVRNFDNLEQPLG